MTPAEVLKYAEKNGAKMVDFKFVDLLGIWQHTTMPIHKLTPSMTDTSSSAARSVAGSRSTRPT
jgi:glutamine synthetase